MGNLIKVFAGLMVLIASILTFISCENDTNPVPLDGIVDVFVQDIKTDAGVKYGIVVYATANYEIKSAKVTAPGAGGKVYQLTASTNKQQFLYIPSTADYTSEMPVNGDYTFEIISTTDETITGKDAVGVEKLAPVVLKTATMANQQLKATWDKITAADGYVVRLYSADKSELLFSSNVLIDKAEFEFGTSTSGWASGTSPVVNTNYVVELIAIKTETGVTFDKWNNIQFFSVDSKTIKWE